LLFVNFLLYQSVSLKISPKGEEALKQGAIKIRVTRSGIIQQITFKVKYKEYGSIRYVELFTERTIELSELSRISNEIGLPVEAPNGKAFPTGTSIADFSVKEQ
jgi:hypothetical protein